MNRRNRRYIKILDEILPPSKDDSINILMIDDEYKNLNAFKAGFRKDANIFIASNKNEALNVVDNNNIDLIFCDYLMPSCNGVEILSDILNKFPSIKSTIVTAYNTLDVIKEFKDKTGVEDFILKPYHFNEITSRIDSVKLCLE